jgi:hypothetical protein
MTVRELRGLRVPTQEVCRGIWKAGAHFLQNRDPDEEVWHLDHTTRKTKFNPDTSAIPFGTLGSAR